MIVLVAGYMGYMVRAKEPELLFASVALVLMSLASEHRAFRLGEGFRYVL